MAKRSPPSAGHLGRRRGVAVLAAAGLATLALAAGAFATTKGGTMPVQLTQVGSLAPVSGAQSREEVERVPLVLWSGLEPAGVVVYRRSHHLLGSDVTQAFVDLGPGRGWEVSQRLHGGKDAAHDPADPYDARGAAAADLDGNGVDELVLVRVSGAVEVWRGGQAGPRLAGPGKAGEYQLQEVAHLRLAGREELLFLFEGPAGASHLVRVDQAGPRAVALRGLPPKLEQILTVGALNRPGSAGVDELLVLSLAEEGGGLRPFLSRHQPDGAALGAPRAVYVPFDLEQGPAFSFVPQSDRAVAFGARLGQLFFFAPEKPANWVRLVETAPLAPAAERYPVHWLGTAGAGATVKALVRREAALYAVDEEGISQTLEGGRWSAAAGWKPFLTVSPPGPPGQVGHWSLVDAIPSAAGPEELLVVQARTAQAREVPEEEQLTAARRFLPPAALADAEFYGTVRMEVDGRVREAEIKQELAERKVLEPVTTVADWQRLAPRSFQAAAAKRHDDLALSLSAALFAPLAQGGKLPAGGREPEAYRAWLEALALPERTAASLWRRGERVVVLELDGAVMREGPGDLRGPVVAFRARGAEVTLVLPLAGPAGARQGRGFFIARTTPPAR